MIILILISGFIRKNDFIFLFYNHYDITMIGHTYSESDDYSDL